MTEREKSAVQLVHWVAEILRAVENGEVLYARFGMANIQVGMLAQKLKVADRRATGQLAGVANRTAWQVDARAIFDEEIARNPDATSAHIRDGIVEKRSPGTPSPERVRDVVVQWLKELRTTLSTE